MFGLKSTNKGEVAILPRKEYEVLAAKAREADEAFGTARLVARARKQICRWHTRTYLKITSCCRSAIKVE